MNIETPIMPKMYDISRIRLKMNVHNNKILYPLQKIYVSSKQICNKYIHYMAKGERPHAIFDICSISSKIHEKLS